MLKIKRSLLILIAFSLPCVFAELAFASAQSIDYLMELGTTYYSIGKYNEALSEFGKVLLIDPGNETAHRYINTIFQQEAKVALEKEKSGVPKQEVKKEVPVMPTREMAMNDAFVSATKEKFKEKYAKTSEKEGMEISGLKIKGRSQVSLGAAPGETIWKRANYDLNERNWRMLSDNAYNKRFNTYDPRIYDSMDVDLDTDNESGFNFHTNITVDPWSFTGKSPKTTLTTAKGDNVEIQLKYWSNTGYTINDTVYTKLKGNSFNLPEIKVRDGKTDATPISGAFTPADTVTIPATKIIRDFQPVRELWLDYNEGPFSLRFFPMAYQDQAFVSDDPLGITNHHIWWEDSLWLRRYLPGIYNSGATPVDFTKGYFDNSVSFLCRNSNGEYVTALRGFSFTMQPQEQTYFSTTIATPKDLWQDYASVDNAISASRLKHSVTDNFSVGATLTTRLGFNADRKYKTDSKNFVGGMDLGYELMDGVKASAEVLNSKSYYDLTNPDYKTDSRGFAYYFSLVTRYPQESIMDLKYGYDEIKLEKGESFLLKSKFFVSHMDAGFDSDLSSFRNTRNDTFWSRHISFRKPFEYYGGGLIPPTLRWDEITATRIGDGIDIGRDVLGFRIETKYEDKFNNLFDARNVHNVNGKFIENVARDEVSVKVNDKLTAKLLGLYQKMPKSRGGFDPFIYDVKTGDFAADWSSNPIDDGLNCSLRTGSMGLEYAFFEWLSANGVWEYTNDYSLAYANYPRSVLNGTQMSNTYYEYAEKYRQSQYYLYDQQLFPQPPYNFYDIYKFGLRITPIEKLEIYLDYTRNEFEMAAQNSDKMNHVGMELTYMPTKKLGIAFKYTYSRWKDLDRLQAGLTNPIGHHNFFGEFRYLPSEDDELILQYGEGNTSPVGNITFDPYGGALLSIDTQHIVRAYYRRKF